MSESAEFYIMSDEEKQEVSTYLVNNGWDLLPNESGVSKYRCPFCSDLDDCVGHYGLLDLESYYPNPLFIRRLTNEIKKCVPSIPVSLLDRDPEKVRSLLPHASKKLIMRYVLVPPPGIRSRDDVEWPNDMSRLYQDLTSSVRTGNKRRVKDILSILFGSKKKSGIIELMSGKDGIFRKMCFGKRINGSARSVITGDPCIDIDQVLVPKYIADTLYVRCTIEENGGPYFVSHDVQLSKIQSIPGTEALRRLQDGDLVFINRQPTLSYGSMLVFRCKIRNDDVKTIGIHPNTTKTFNADFDGDEMNLFLFPYYSDLERCKITNHPECISEVQDSKVARYLFGEPSQDPFGKTQFRKLDEYGLTVTLTDLVNKRYENTGLSAMIKSGSKGSEKNQEQMMIEVGKQYLRGREVGHCKRSFVNGLSPDEFFTHQQAAREGIVSTGVSTSGTGYINRKGTRNMADVMIDENGLMYDNYGIIGKYDWK
jgi:hypothetical protein